MADFTRRPIAPRMINEEIHPSSGWTSNPEFHFLLVDVPGYEKDDIKLSVARTIVVKGSRRKAENRREHFEKSFEVPEDGDIQNISMEYDGLTLRVRVPKVPKQQPKDREAPKTSVITKNKGILLASLVSFTLGVLVSRKFHHPPHPQ